MKKFGLSCETFQKLCMIMDRAVQPQDRGDSVCSGVTADASGSSTVCRKTAVKPWFSSVNVPEECS